jgi:hypothetical protein
VLSGDAVLIADINFSRSATLGLTFATRLLTMDDFCMTSGTALPITDERILLEIDSYLRRTCQKVKDFRSMPHDRALLLESFIIRACLAARAAQHIHYENA